MSTWSQLKPFNEVCRRAGGRRAYNALRRAQKIFRRHDVMQLLLKYGYRRGVQARIATVLGVSEATISRDVNATLCAAHACAHCGSYRPIDIRFAKAE